MRLDPRTPPAAQSITFLVVVVGFGFCVAANFPGHLSYDSVIQLLEGRTARYSGWHPTIMSWLLGIADTFVRGTALYVPAVALLYFAAIASLLWLRRKPSWLAAGVAVLVLLSPQVLIYQGIVWKDVLFANAATAAFVALANLQRQWSRPVLRYLLIALTLVLLTVAALTRQNGPILLPLAAITIAWIARQNEIRLSQAAAYGSGAFLAFLALFFASGALLETRVPGEPGQVRQWKLLETYDLIAALAAQPSLSLHDLQQQDPAFLHLMRTDGRKFYSPQRNDTLTRSAPLQRALAAAPADLLRTQWLAFIRDEHRLYLRNRVAMFRWVFFTPDIAACVPIYLGVDGPPAVLKRLGLKPRFDVRDMLLQRYGYAFLRTPVFSHLTFLLLALLEICFLCYRRRVADIALAMMLVGAILFTLSFFVISIACDYRYLYFLDLAAITALFYVALDPRLYRAAQSPKG